MTTAWAVTCAWWQSVVLVEATMRNALRAMLDPGWELQTADDLKSGGLDLWLRHPDGREGHLRLSNAELVYDPAGTQQRILAWAATVGQAHKTRQIEVSDAD